MNISNVLFNSATCPANIDVVNAGDAGLGALILTTGSLIAGGLIARNIWPRIRNSELIRRVGEPIVMKVKLTVLQMQRIVPLIRTYTALYRRGLLSLEDCKTLLSNTEHAWDFANSFRILNDHGLLTSENFPALLPNKEHAWNFTKSVQILHGSGLLNENFEALLANAEHALSLAEGLAQLKVTDLLGARDALIAHPKQAKDLANSFTLMLHRDLFTEPNYDALLQRAHDPAFIRAFFDAANNSDFPLTQDRFNDIMGKKLAECETRDCQNV